MDLASPRDFSHTLEIQGALEAFAARLAAQHGINSAQRVLLQQYVASMEEIAVAFGAWSMDFLDRYADMSRRFHLLVFELAQSSILQRHVAEDFVNQFAL
jgi:DNA-binding GntR family transcriptional regulator